MPEVVVTGSFKVNPGKEEEALDAHLESDHVSALLKRAEELWGENGEITVYEPVPAGETRKGSLAEHAGG